MQRREFIGLVGGATALLPRASHAQTAKKPIIGYFNILSKDAETPFRVAFWQGLADFGFIENQNVTVMYRYLEGRYEPERVRTFAEELVRQPVDIIVAANGVPAIAAKLATSTIPIVFLIGADPIELELVASYNKPGANVTGINVAPESLTVKRIELLNDLVPGPLPIAELINPAATRKVVDYEKRIAGEAAKKLGRELIFVYASKAAEIAPAFEEIRRKHAVGLTIWFESLFQNNRDQIVSLSEKYRIVTTYPERKFAESGGLLSYGPLFPLPFRQVGTYAGKILKGTRPQDLPVMNPTTYELVINQRTARSLGVTIPPMLLARADEVIE